MELMVFDERICRLGEGPTSRGKENSLVTWIDIHGHKVLWRDLITSELGSFETPAEVGFCLPCDQNGYVVGHASGATIRNEAGHERSLFSNDIDQPKPVDEFTRWNDAKVAPNGDLFAGTMAFDGTRDGGSLYRISSAGENIERIIPSVSISNGLDWSSDGTRFYYIDTLSYKLVVFDFSNSTLSNQRTLIEFDQNEGMPDGMCMDSEDGIWIAFWGGRGIRRYSSDGKLTEKISLPVQNVTSCAFAGLNLETLIITTALDADDSLNTSSSGMTFSLATGVRGKKTEVFSTERGASNEI